MESAWQNVRYPLITGILFSGSYISAKAASNDLGPITASLLRYAVAFLFLTLLLFRFGVASIRVEKRDLPKMAFLGLSGVVGYHTIFMISLAHTQVANTAIINATSPILTAILASWILKERLTTRNVYGVGMAFVGVILLLTRGRITNLIGLDINIGDAIMLAATLSWVFFALTVKTLLKKYNSFTLTYHATLSGVLMLLALSAIENPIPQMKDMSLKSGLGILYMGLFASGLAYILYSMSVDRIGPTKTSSFVYSVVPIFVSIQASLFFGQTVTPVMAFSILMIVIGLRFMLKK